MRRLAMAALALAVVAPAAATASDQSVYSAWTSRDADFSRLGKQFTRAARVYRRSHGRRIKPTLRVSRKTIAVIDHLLPAIQREKASSKPGRRGKALAVASVRLLRSSLVKLRSGVRARDAGRLRRSGRLARQSRRVERKARSFFKKAGVL